MQSTSGPTNLWPLLEQRVEAAERNMASIEVESQRLREENAHVRAIVTHLRGKVVRLRAQLRHNRNMNVMRSDDASTHGHCSASSGSLSWQSRADNRSCSSASSLSPSASAGEDGHALESDAVDTEPNTRHTEGRHRVHHRHVCDALALLRQLRQPDRRRAQPVAHTLRQLLSHAHTTALRVVLTGLDRSEAMQAWDAYVCEGSRATAVRVRPTADLLHDVALCLQRLNDQGIVHLNVTPTTVLVERASATAWLSDFAAAHVLPVSQPSAYKMARKAHRRCVNMLSAAHADRAITRAPEFEHCRTIGPAADKWSFGVLAWLAGAHTSLEALVEHASKRLRCLGSEAKLTDALALLATECLAQRGNDEAGEREDHGQLYVTSSALRRLVLGCVVVQPHQRLPWSQVLPLLTMARGEEADALSQGLSSSPLAYRSKSSMLASPLTPARFSMMGGDTEVDEVVTRLADDLARASKPGRDVDPQRARHMFSLRERSPIHLDSAAAAWGAKSRPSVRAQSLGSLQAHTTPLASRRRTSEQTLAFAATGQRQQHALKTRAALVTLPMVPCNDTPTAHGRHRALFLSPGLSRSSAASPGIASSATPSPIPHCSACLETFDQSRCRTVCDRCDVALCELCTIGPLLSQRGLLRCCRACASTVMQETALSSPVIPRAHLQLFRPQLSRQSNVKDTMNVVDVNVRRQVDLLRCHRNRQQRQEWIQQCIKMNPTLCE